MKIEKLLKIQQELKAPKNQRNDFGKYNYRSCEDILEAVKPLLKENNLILTLNDELVQIGERYYIKATATLTDVNEPADKITNTAYAREEETKKGMDGSQITGASSSYARKYALNGLFLIDDVKDSDATNMGEDKKEWTYEEAQNYEITFGKHKGKKIKDIPQNYLDWLLESDKANLSIKTVIETFYKGKGINILSDEKKAEKLTLMGDLNDLFLRTGVDRDNMYKHYKVSTDSDMTIEQLKDAISKLKGKEG